MHTLLPNRTGLTSSEGPMSRILALFPDTNVFVQCRPLHELKWSEWSEFDEVRLIVCRVVQAEIDKHKNRGGERLARRARAASTMIKKLIKSTDKCEVIRDARPRVTLELNVSLRPNPDAPDTFDYDQPDDWLVGTALAFAQQNADFDVRVLTDDAGPMASADAVGIRIAEVPEEWMLPPERGAAEKEIGALRAEIELLKEQEPRIVIECKDNGGKKLSEIVVVRTVILNV
jgi:predicted ribonuclease YlaK